MPTNGMGFVGVGDT
jgi:tetratricopeptide (TPR) repeat protein